MKLFRIYAEADIHIFGVSKIIHCSNNTNKNKLQTHFLELVLTSKHLSFDNINLFSSICDSYEKLSRTHLKFFLGISLHLTDTTAITKPPKN